MKNEELISVVMPVYNRADLIPRVLPTLIGQTYKNLEFVIVDDCSDDNIEAALAVFDDPRIKLVRRKQNGGAAAARSTGIEAATGRFIAFHDSDDFCVPDRFERSMRLLDSLPDDYIGVYGAVLFYPTDLTPESYIDLRAFTRLFPMDLPLEGDMFNKTVAGNCMNLPTFLVKAEAVRAAAPFDPLLRRNVDWDFTLRLTKQGKFGFVPEPMILSPSPQDPEIIGQRVSRSDINGARSYVRITGKLRHSGIRGPALAKHYAVTASYLMRLGRPGLARRFARAAIRENPIKPKPWLHLIFSYMPGTHTALRGLKARMRTKGKQTLQDRERAIKKVQPEP